MPETNPNLTTLDLDLDVLGTWTPPAVLGVDDEADCPYGRLPLPSVVSAERAMSEHRTRYNRSQWGDLVTRRHDEWTALTRTLSVHVVERDRAGETVDRYWDERPSHEWAVVLDTAPSAVLARVGATCNGWTGDEPVWGWAALAEDGEPDPWTGLHSDPWSALLVALPLAVERLAMRDA